MTQIVRNTLVSLALLNLWGLYISPALCGTLRVVVDAFQSEDFAGSTYSGVSLVDKPLSFIFYAYLSVLDYGTLESMHMTGLLGGLAGIWIMSAAESYRTKSGNQFAKDIFLIGVPSMFIGASLGTPLYLAFNCVPPRLRQKGQVVQNEPHILYQMQRWIIAIFYLPVLSLILPPSVALSPTLNQHAILLLSTSQLWVAMRVALSHGNETGKRSTASSAKVIPDFLYTSTCIVVSAFHVLPITCAIAIQKQSGSILGAIIPALKTIFIPGLPWASPMTSSGQEFIWYMWQWDYIVIALASIIWSLSLYIHECHNAKEPIRYAKLCLTMILWTVFTGPFAASVVILSKKNKISEQPFLEGKGR